jgi:hypothetical protein
MSLSVATEGMTNGVKPDSGVRAYEQAFSRHIGWVTLTEQEMLRSASQSPAWGVAVSTCVHARSSRDRRNVADFDAFNIVTSNACWVRKIQALAAMAKDINHG